MLPDMFRFIVDTQLPPSLAEFFRRRGLDATHVIDYFSGALMTDDEIISVAIKESRIVVSKDDDFFDYFLLKNYPPAILLLKLGNIKNSELFVFMGNYLDTICNLFTEDIKRLILISRSKIVIY
jgi:predicted nuclease of predicted toxin-antitoxin system